MARPTLNRLDRRILEILQANGRLTNLELAGRVSLSPSACLRRVRALEESGVPPEDLAEVHCPLGIEIGAVSPEEIAVSVLAQMIAVRHAVPPSAIAPMKMELPGRLKVRR